MKTCLFSLLVSAIIIVSAALCFSHTIDIDGNMDDWGGAAGDEGTLVVSEGEAIWNDYVDDDTGEGKYEYPSFNHPAYNDKNGMDIDEFRVTADDEYMYFRIKLVGPVFYVVFGVLIDTGPGGSTTVGNNANIDLPDDLAWDVGIFHGDGGGPGGERTLLNVSYDGGETFPTLHEWDRDNAEVESSYKYLARPVEFRVPIARAAGEEGIPNPVNKVFKFIVLCSTGNSGVPAGGMAEFRTGVGQASEWTYGGLSFPGKSPNVLDAIGSTPKQQEEDLSGAKAGKFTLLESSFITVAFNSKGEATLAVDPFGSLSTTWGRIKGSS